MDDFVTEYLHSANESTAHHVDEDGQATAREPELVGSRMKKTRGFRRGFFKAANLQDKLLEKFLTQVLPSDGKALGGDTSEGDPTPFSHRPGFTVTTMSNNFRRFNARIGVVFKFQARVMRLLSWRRPSHTLSLLAVFTFLCLDPYLLCVLPLVLALFGILVPSFMARHPAPPHLPSPEQHVQAYSPRGPPIAPARTVRPVKELSRDFFRNMGDLQNSMDDFSVAHDKIVALLVPVTNFSDETLSSAVFLLLAAAAAIMSVAAHLLPWRLLVLAAGWTAILSGHPAMARMVRPQAKAESGDDKAKAGKAGAAQVRRVLDDWACADIILDEAPETREVEIFELQRLGHTSGEWEAWTFSPSPYDPLSAARIAGERPSGTRFFEDVLPPRGWEWSGKKWALDLWSREWVEERIITGVEVETEGERWVYDIHNEHEHAAGLVDSPMRHGRNPPRTGHLSTLSWEEGEEGMGRRGEWRRRRWVRLVRRRNVEGDWIT